MLKWRVSRYVARHPTKRVKITARRNQDKNELLCDLASGQEFLEARDVFFVRANLLGLQRKYCLYDGQVCWQRLSQFLDEISLIVLIGWSPFHNISFLV